MAVYVIKIGFGVRRLGMTTPVDGPCSPPYLAADRFIRYVAIEAPDQMTAELDAFEMADVLSTPSDTVMTRESPQPGSRPSFPGRIVVGGDMVTSIETVEAVL